MKIRPFQIFDLPYIMKISNVEDGFFDVEDWIFFKKIYKTKCATAVATVNETPRGCLSITLMERQWWILINTGEFKAELLTQALKELDDDDLRVVIPECWVDLLNFYRDYGFSLEITKEDHFFIDGTYFDGYIMKKGLT